jgi:glycosyltransferase involved in cell wall biosynthesis
VECKFEYSRYITARMKVTFFYRPKTGAYSIEGVFKVIRDSLPINVVQTEYICTTKLKRFYSFFKARKFQSEINHITGDVHTLALFLNPKKTILTVHDISHYEFDLQRGLRKWLIKLLWIKYPFRRVSIITVISQFTKERIMEVAQVPESKIRVIPNPIDVNFFKFDPFEFNESQPVILQIGSKANKNVYRLVEAIKDLNFKLLLVRKPNADLKDLIEKYNISYEWKTDVSNEELLDCYRMSDIVYFVSENEGFGVPIIEANSVGRPVITSNIPPMSDVAGEAAVLVDPFNISDIRDGLLKISKDKDLRDKLIQVGIENVQRFKKENIAMLYYNVYKEILEKNNA